MPETTSKLNPRKPSIFSKEGAVDLSDNSIASTSSDHFQAGDSTSTAKPRIKKAPDLLALERRNWLLHLHYVRKEFSICKTLIKGQLDDSQGTCEYALYIQALILRQEGRIQESLELFQTCSMLNASSDNLKQVARSLYLLGRHKPAIDVYEEAARLSSKDWDVCHNLGICYIHLKDFDQAKQLFQEALQQRQHEETFSALCRLCLLQNDVKGAVAVLRKAVELYPENCELGTKLGLLYMQCGMYQKAFERLGSALTFAPTYVAAIVAAGSIMQAHGDFDVALTKYRVATSVIPESAALWNNIGMCFFGKKKYVAAVSCLKRANYLAPFDWQILHNLGLVHLTMQQFASAFHFLSAGINLHPHSGRLFMLLAIVLRCLEDYNNSKQAYIQAVQRDPQDPIIPLNFAVLLHHVNDTKGAAAQFQNFSQRWLKTQKGSQGEIEEDLLETATQLADALNLHNQLPWQKPPRPISAIAIPADQPALT